MCRGVKLPAQTHLHKGRQLEQERGFAQGHQSWVLISNLKPTFISHSNPQKRFVSQNAFDHLDASDPSQRMT
jgi:hypothetical protein